MHVGLDFPSWAVRALAVLGTVARRKDRDHVFGGSSENDIRCQVTKRKISGGRAQVREIEGGFGDFSAN
jgi:hypothetical protein